MGNPYNNQTYTLKMMAMVEQIARLERVIASIESNPLYYWEHPDDPR